MRRRVTLEQMAQHIFRFRNFRLDTATRQLWRDGERVPLPLKSFDCLTYLIEHRDRAVGRDELIAAVWGRAEVSDKLLGQTLLRARRAIGEASGEHTSIRTLPRFGYHWEEPVDVDMPSTHATASTDASTEAERPPSFAAVESAHEIASPRPVAARRHRSWWIAAAVVAALTL